MMIYLIRGAMAMGYLVAAGFFCRFWRESRDRLFGLFALAFTLMAVNCLWQSAIHENVDNSISPYVIRLLTYLLILVAIIDKNLRPVR
jgi:hypothetical protein